MAKKVLKFGGTSVGTIERIQHVASIVKKEHDAGNNVVVIVSAMARKTNELIKLSNEISDKFNKRELDVLLSSGEQVTSALLAGALIKLNIKAKSWMNWQIPILTEGEHSNARIINMNVEKINKYLNEKGVVIIPGFQGISKSADITTIGKIFGGGMPIGIIGLNNKIKNKIESQNKNIFFGGTFSGNSLSTFIGNETVKYLMKKKKLLTELNKKSKYFQETLNEFIVKNNLDLKIYRYASILRIVYTKNKIQNRFQRDFFENKNSLKIKSFRKYLFTKKIYYPTNGIIFFSASSSYSNIRYVIKCIKGGFKKIF